MHRGVYIHAKQCRPCEMVQYGAEKRKSIDLSVQMM